MSTRSAIYTDKSEDMGRYIHFDGYPAWVGKCLVEFIKRDEVQKAIKALTEDHYGWSSLGADEESKNDYERGYERGYYDARFELVDDYGIAYTEVENQTGPDHWVPFGDCDFSYRIHDDGIIEVYHWDKLLGTIDTTSDDAVEQMLLLDE